MTAHTTTETLELPSRFVQRLRRIAATTHRSVEDVLTATVETMLPIDENLDAALADELTAMQLFSDDALIAAVRPSITPAQEARLTQLTSASDSRELSKSEQQEVADLLLAVDRSMLRRAQALALLKLRGHSINGFLDPAQFSPA